MNILITSIGQRGYLVEHFQEASNGQYGIYAADAFPYAPALKNAEKAFRIPLAKDQNYFKALLKICKENNIGAIFSINDLELPYLAQYKNNFLEKGINVVICDSSVIEVCTDKYFTYDFCKKNNIGVPKTYLYSEKEYIINDLLYGKIDYPIVAKPRRGSKSIGIYMIENEDELLKAINENKSNLIPEENKYIFQEKLKGVLIAAHVICNKNHEPISIVTMKNLTEHFGETYQNKTYKDEDLYKFVFNAASVIKAYGIMDLNIMQKENGEFVLLEFNPRISGGYSLSHFANPQFTKNLLSIAAGIEVQQDMKSIYNFNEIIMLKQFSTTWTTEEKIKESVI